MFEFKEYASLRPNASGWEEIDLQVLTGSDLKKIFSVAAQALVAAKERVNALNVFPVPDGDTGTNMALTLQAAVRELDKLDTDDVSIVAASIARGSLMGARGNSGVILSQYFRGFSDGLAKVKHANGEHIAKAFDQASKTTYKAVMKPVEGTMLTVGKGIAEACKEAVAEQEDLSAVEVWRIGMEAGKKTLANTPNILPVLKQAGVVDAGGEGLLVALDGAYRALIGKADDLISKANSVSQAEQLVSDFQDQSEGIGRIEGDLVNKYCTEFFIKGDNLEIDQIRTKLDPKGDSLLVVGEADLVKIHIHTDRPGLVLDICSELGDLTDIKIDNMKLQNEHFTENENNVVEFPVDKMLDAALESEDPKETGIVAVVPGDGLAEIFTSLGVDKVIAGGQTMNPSTEELVRAVEEVNAESVVILPNNKNVVFSAQQVKEFVDKNVEVVVTKTIPQGISALMGYSSHLDLQENLEAMQDGVQQVQSGEITYAVRSTKAGELQIEEQDFIGLAEGKIVVAGQSLNTVGLQLLDNLVDEDSSLISIYTGDEQGQAAAEEFKALVQEKHPDCEVELYEGGQPLYYYILSVE